LELTLARPVGLGIFWIMAEDAIILAVLAVFMILNVRRHAVDLKGSQTGSRP